MISTFFFSKNGAVYEMISKNAVQQEKSQVTKYGASVLHSG
jgi:hypothetical protein